MLNCNLKFKLFKTINYAMKFIKIFILLKLRPSGTEKGTLSWFLLTPKNMVSLSILSKLCCTLLYWRKNIF